MKLATGAVIPAAGFSSRMEGFKPLLKIADKTMIEHAITLFEQSGVEDIVVVLGHRAEEVVPVVEKTTARWQKNARFSEGMFSSIQCGVESIRSSVDAFFLLPVDIPLVTTATLLRLLDCYKRDSAKRILYPSFQGRRGHPPLIATGLSKAILGYEGTGGMRGFLRNYENEAGEVAVTDRFVAMDADTPAQFSRLQEAYLGK